MGEEEELGVLPPIRVQFQRISKHRAGRTRPLTKKERGKLASHKRQMTQLRKKVYLEHQADLRALQAAMADD